MTVIATNIRPLSALYAANRTASAAATYAGFATSELLEGEVDTFGHRGVPLIVPYGVGADDNTFTIGVGVAFRFGDWYLRALVGSVAGILGTVTGSAGAPVGSGERFAKSLTWTPNELGTALFGLYGVSVSTAQAGSSPAILSVPDVGPASKLFLDPYRGTATSVNIAAAAGG